MNSEEKEAIRRIELQIIQYRNAWHASGFPPLLEKVRELEAKREAIKAESAKRVEEERHQRDLEPWRWGYKIVGGYRSRG